MPRLRTSWLITAAALGLEPGIGVHTGDSEAARGTLTKRCVRPIPGVGVPGLTVMEVGSGRADYEKPSVTIWEYRPAPLLLRDDLAGIEILTGIHGGEQAIDHVYAWGRDVLFEPRGVFSADCVVVRERATAIHE